MDVEKRYLQIATDLGWKREEAKTTKPEATPASDSDDGIWDKEGQSNRSGGIGFGLAVSTMSFAGEDTREKGTLHQYAVSGDARGLREFLQTHSDVGLDAKDEYVSAVTE